MNEPLWIRVYRIAFALLALVAVVRKYFYDGDSVANWLSKFTMEANAYVAVILLGGAVLAPAVRGSVRWDRLRGAAVMYMVTTFFVYGFLVSSFDNPFDTTRHWTHTVLHQVIPVVVVLDILIRPFVNRLSWGTAVLWTIYPVLYLAYSLIRGELVGWYPYDFIDPAETGGWGAVAINVTGITIGFLALALLIVWVSHLYHRPLSTPPAPMAPTTAWPH